MSLLVPCKRVKVSKCLSFLDVIFREIGCDPAGSCSEVPFEAETPSNTSAEAERQAVPKGRSAGVSKVVNKVAKH